MIPFYTFQVVLLVFSLLCWRNLAFVPTLGGHFPSTTQTTKLGELEQPVSSSSCSKRVRKKSNLMVLQMAKKMRNNQASLAKKLALAKEQAKKQEGGDGDEPTEETTTKSAKLSAAEIKEQNDRLRFEELLKSQASSVLNDYSSDGYLNQQQEEEEIIAARSGFDRLFEGDPAPSAPFEELVSLKTENALGESGAKRLVPWLRDSSDYLIVVCDPRMKSPELYQTAKTLRLGLEKHLRQRLIFINADTPAENRRWLKKTEQLDSIDVYSDEKMEWMRTYTALGDKRWSMTMFIMSDGQVQKIARDLESVSALRVIQNAAKSMVEPKI